MIECTPDISLNLATALTDLGTHLKMTSGIQDGMAKYFEAIQFDPTYAVRFFFSLLFFKTHLGLTQLT